MEESWTLKAILGVGKLPYISRIHTAFIGEDSSILGTERNVWWYDVICSWMQSSEICSTWGQLFLISKKRNWHPEWRLHAFFLAHVFFSWISDASSIWPQLLQVTGREPHNKKRSTKMISITNIWICQFHIKGSTTPPYISSTPTGWASACIGLV